MNHSDTLKPKLLRIVLDGEENPHYTVTKAFNAVFDTTTIWWQQYDVPSLNSIILEQMSRVNYDFVFMQLQSKDIIYTETAELMSKMCPVFNWTGDVRTDISDYVRLGKYCTTLFTNMTDVTNMRGMGLDADYLQIGYDHIYYCDTEMHRANRVVFCGNTYPSENFPLTKERVEMATALQRHYGKDFLLYGGGWDNFGVASLGTANNALESAVYNSCLIAINYSHFNYGRYFSDRLLREMACGALVLSHDYKDSNLDFQIGKHLDVFTDTKDLIEKCDYYFINREEARNIAIGGRDLVQAEFNWNAVVDRFLKIANSKK